AVLRVRLNRDSGVRIEELKERLRQKLPDRLGEYLRQRLRADGLPEEKIAQRVAGLRLSFEPADIVNEVVSSGWPTTIEVAVSGSNLAANRAHAEKIQRELQGIPSLQDLQYVQALDYPTVEVTVDREKAGKSGVTTEAVARSTVVATSSS